MDFLMLSDKDYEMLTKCITIGVFIEIVLGAILDDVILYFALGGVVGILTSIMITIILKKSERIQKSNADRI